MHDLILRYFLFAINFEVIELFFTDKVDTRSIKEINYSLILRHIKINGPISRIELANKTGLNPSTISRAIKTLQNLNLVTELSIGESQGGRRPMLLGLDNTKYHIVGIDIGATKITTVIVDLKGRIKEDYQYKIQSTNNGIINLSLEEVYKCIYKVINKFDNNFKDKKIIGIGVGLHGMVNKEEGKSIFAPNFGWRDIEIVKLIEEKFELKTIVDNDVRAMSLGEYWFGAAQNIHDFITLNIGYGIGSGIMIGGRLYRGSHSMAGEVGHTTVDEDGPYCNCGNYGCLEVLASGPAIAKEARKLVKRGRKSIIPKLVNGDLDQISGELVFKAAEKGDLLAQQVFQSAGSYLGIGIANMVNIIDPELLILGGGVSNAEEYLIANLKDILKHKVLGELPDIKTAKLADNAGAIGASVLIMEEIFYKPHSFMNNIN